MPRLDIWREDGTIFVQVEGVDYPKITSILLGLR